jgi:hypothetical protein
MAMLGPWRDNSFVILLAELTGHGRVLGSSDGVSAANVVVSSIGRCHYATIRQQLGNMHLAAF